MDIFIRLTRTPVVEVPLLIRGQGSDYLHQQLGRLHRTILVIDQEFLVRKVLQNVYQGWHSADPLAPEWIRFTSVIRVSISNVEALQVLKGMIADLAPTICATF